MKHCRRIPHSGFTWLPVLVVLLGGAGSSFAQSGWTLSPPITDRQLNGVTAGKGLFVAVGQDGAVLTSDDGLGWAEGSVGTNTYLLGVGFGAGTFVAVGYGGALYTSTDALSWSAQPSGTTNWLLDVAYGKNLFVAVGDSGTILTSPDAVTWTPRASGTASLLGGVAFGDDQFIAAGSDGALLTSTNGLSWTSAGAIGAQPWLFDVAFGYGAFVAVGEATSIYTSSSHATLWSKAEAGTNLLYLSGVTFGANTFVVVGEGGTILTSPNGVNWTLEESPTDRWLLAAAANNGTVVGVGTAGTIVVAQLGQAAPLEMFDPQLLPTGEFRCQVSGVRLGQLVTLWATEDAGAPRPGWTLVAQLAANSDPISITDPYAARHSHRFYRVSQ